MKFVMIAAITILIVLMSAYISSSQSKLKQQPAVMNSFTDQNSNPNQIREIEIEAGSFYFRPNEIRVKQGEKVRLKINSVSMMHDLVIDELNVKAPIIKNGETGTVEFMADKVGTYEYYCSVGSHRQNGQVGTLIVEE